MFIDVKAATQAHKVSNIEEHILPIIDHFTAGQATKQASNCKMVCISVLSLRSSYLLSSVQFSYLDHNNNIEIKESKYIYLQYSRQKQAC